LSISSVKRPSLFLIAAAALSLHCLPGPKESSLLPSPYDLRVETVSSGANIFWSANRSEGQIISGYNIYLSEESLKPMFPDWRKSHPEPYNHAPYPGDTDGDITAESFEITGLENGRKYYVSVRTVGTNGTESKPSNEMAFTPMARGEFVISSFHTRDDGGFNFDREISVPARDPRCDIYLYSKGDDVGLSSPHRLGAGLRKTGFVRYADKSGEVLETIKIDRGDRLTVLTRNGRADLTVKRIDRRAEPVTAVMEYVFYPDDYLPGR
jgi:hypothetical protein